MATNPVIEFPPNLAAMVLAYKRNKSSEYLADRNGNGDQADVFGVMADALAKSVRDRVDHLLAVEGVTLADLADAGL